MTEGLGLIMGMAAGMLTSEMGGWGALAINALAGAVGSNIDAIDNAVHGKAINWKSMRVNAGSGAVLGVLWGELSFDEIQMVGVVNKTSEKEFTQMPIDGIKNTNNVKNLYLSIARNQYVILNDGGHFFVIGKGSDNDLFLSELSIPQGLRESRGQIEHLIRIDSQIIREDSNDYLQMILLGEAGYWDLSNINILESRLYKSPHPIENVRKLSSVYQGKYLHFVHNKMPEGEYFQQGRVGILSCRRFVARHFWKPRGFWFRSSPY